MHIPKTAGLSLQGLVRRRYKQPGALKLIYDREDIVQGFADDPDLQLVMGHYRYGYHQFTQRPYRYICFMRDPVEQVVSHYHFYLDHPHKFKALKEAPSDLLDFARGPYGYNFQTCFVSGMANIHGREKEALAQARENLGNFALVGITEAFDLSLLMLGRMLGWSICYYDRVNLGKGRQQRPGPTEAERESLEELLTPDRELYAQARAQWEQQKENWPEADAALRRFQRENRIFQLLNPAYIALKKSLRLIRPHPADRTN